MRPDPIFLKTCLIVLKVFRTYLFNIRQAFCQHLTTLVSHLREVADICLHEHLNRFELSWKSVHQVSLQLIQVMLWSRSHIRDVSCKGWGQLSYKFISLD